MASTQHLRVRIGIDVGGTNTDAVVLDPSQHAAPNRGVIAHYKAPTTSDAVTGIETALHYVLEKSQLSLQSISSVTIGTTAFLNAVIERDSLRLSRVGVLRLSKSFLRDIHPLSGWPAGLASLIKGHVGYVDGGLNIDGSEEAKIVEEQVIRECNEFRKQGLDTIVVAGVYSPIDQEFQQENTVRQIILRHLPGVDVVCSHEVAHIGFLERENAAILNAAILKYARQTISSFEGALNRLGLTNCPLYLTQNDGTVLEVATAAQIPIRTFSSGVTNSMRGAAYLSGITKSSGNGQAAIVIDIGGTTTDVGILLPSGLPRQASAYVSVAGVKVNYALPHIHSIGLGGGSVVTQRENGDVLVGPTSIGHRIQDSVIFGGKTITATDVAVAAGLEILGSVEAVKNFSPELITTVLSHIRVALEQAVDAVKTSSEELPVLLTGGGSILAPNSLNGVSKVIKLPFFDVANAVGAACSKVGATIDMIQSTAEKSMTEVTEEVKRLAISKAVEKGAVKGTTYIALVDAIPIPYLQNQVRFIVTAIGDLGDIATSPRNSHHPLSFIPKPFDLDYQANGLSPHIEFIDSATDHETYRPTVILNEDTKSPEWHLGKVDLNYIADGCYLLGCGGGGNPEAGKLQLLGMVDAGHRIRVVDASRLQEDSLVYWGGRMGSPAAISERLQAHETVLAIQALMEYMRHDSFHAVMALEIGGSNGMEPFLWGSSRFFDRPVIDGDFMGRANPMCWQTTLTVHQPGNFVPCAIDSGTGRTIIMTRAPEDESVDKPLRAAISELGSLVGLAPRPTTAGAVQRYGVLKSISLAWRIGRAIAKAEASSNSSRAAESIVSELGGAKSALILFRGKITSIERTLQKGLSVGVLNITHSSDSEPAASALASGGSLRIPFINENILAEHISEDGSKRILATVPDLIALIDRDTGKAVGVPEYKYGCHVVVIGISCSPRWTETTRGIEIGGPRGYGYDLDYIPLGEYEEPRSVIEEYFDSNTELAAM